MTRVVWAEVSESGLGIITGPRQQKLWRHPTVQLMGNLAVCLFCLFIRDGFSRHPRSDISPPLLWPFTLSSSFVVLSEVSTLSIYFFQAFVSIQTFSYIWHIHADMFCTLMWELVNSVLGNAPYMAQLVISSFEFRNSHWGWPSGMVRVLSLAHQGFETVCNDFCFSYYIVCIASIMAIAL